jgi:hypothetical protein
LVKFAKACKTTGPYKLPNTSATPGNQAFVASVYPLDRARALAEMTCNACGGRGHKGQDCASAKITTPRPGDGTSKPKTNVDREFTFRDNSAGTSSRSTSKPAKAGHAQQGHTQRGAIGGQGGTAQSALIGRVNPINFLFLCRKKRNLPFLLEHFALSQRDYGKYVPALASGGAARSTKVLSKRAIEGPSI